MLTLLKFQWDKHFFTYYDGVMVGLSQPLNPEIPRPAGDGV